MSMYDDEVIIKELTYDVDDEYEEEEEEFTEEIKDKRSSSVDTNQSTVIKDGFGLYNDIAGGGDNVVIHRYTIVNKNGIAVQIITYGATVISVKTPDKNGHMDDIAMGFENLQGYTSERNPYFGATIGRITGVIPDSVFSIRDTEHYLTNNYLKHHANGGVIGFDKVIWNSYVSKGKLYLSYMSPDMEEGFPGDVVVNRMYELNIDNELIVETTAHCSKSTPIDISTHIDWNLASHSGGPKELYKHYLMVNADKYAQVGKDRLMTGRMKRVGRTVFDLRIPRPLGRIIHRVPGGGYDHFMHLIRGPDKRGVTFAAKLTHADSGRFMEVMSDQPGVFVYTQNNLYAEQHIIEAHPVSCWCYDPLLILEQKKLQNPLDMHITTTAEGNPCTIKGYGPLFGKIGAGYRRHGGIRIVPVNYPQPVAAHYDLSTFLVRPGETYCNKTIFKFGNIFDKEHDPFGVCPMGNFLI